MKPKTFQKSKHLGEKSKTLSDVNGRMMMKVALGTPCAQQQKNVTG